MVWALYVTAAICLSAECAKNVSWPSLSALWRWGSLTMAFTGKLAYMWLTISSCYGSITLPLGLMGRDTGLSTLCHSCRFACQQKVKINVSLPWRFALRGWGSLTMAFTDKFLYMGLTILSCYGSILPALGLIGRNGDLSTLYHSCGFACQQRVQKTFSGPGYLHSDDGVVWLWHSLINFYICGPPFHVPTAPLTLGLIGKDGGLSTLCHSCRFACQRKVLKTFPSPGYLLSGDGVVWLWYSLLNLYICG